MHHIPFEKYYAQKARGRSPWGETLPYFAGGQHRLVGSGLGSILGSLYSKFKTALPWLFKNVAKNVLSSGAAVANDMLQGKTFKDSAKEHALRGFESATDYIVP